MLTLTEHYELAAMAVDAGIQRYEQSRNPDGDRVSKGKAERLLKQYGKQAVLLQRWTDAGLLRPVKHGEKQNSPVYYSLAAIKGLLYASAVKRAFD